MAGHIRYVNAADLFEAAAAVGAELFYYVEGEGELAVAWPVAMSRDGARVWDSGESIAVDDLRLADAKPVQTYQLI